MQVWLNETANRVYFSVVLLPFLGGGFLFLLYVLLKLMVLSF